jgi:hypothetical protein
MTAVVFQQIFQRLGEILRKHAGGLVVQEDSPAHLTLVGGTHPRHQRPMPVAWVKIGKSYVSFHLMPVYGCPKLLDNFSAELRARMQGKSCFNFKVFDEALFEELDRLTIASFTAFKRAGYLPEKQ